MIYQERLLYRRFIYYTSILLIGKIFVNGLSYTIVRMFTNNPDKIMAGTDMVCSTLILAGILTLLGNTLFSIKNVRDNVSDNFDPYLWFDKPKIELLHYCEDRIHAGISIRRINRILYDHEMRINYSIDANGKNLSLYSIDGNNKRVLETIRFNKTRADYMNIARSKITNALNQYSSDQRVSQRVNLIKEIRFSLDFIGLNPLNAMLGRDGLIVNLKKPSNIYDLLESPIIQLKKKEKEEVIEEISVFDTYGW